MISRARVGARNGPRTQQTLRVHVSNLREKDRTQAPATARYIVTEPGVGFRLSVPEEADAS